MTTYPLVFVDGLDGSGKSTLAKQLRDRLEAAGLHPLLLAVDDFRQTVDWTQTAIPEAKLYAEQYFNLLALDAILKTIATGARTIELPSFEENGGTTYRLQIVPLEPFVVVEGVFSQRLTLASSAALVYVDCSWEEARDRIMARDQARGRSAADVHHRIETRYFPAQRRYQQVHAPRERAHWIVAYETRGAPRVGRYPQPLRAPSLTSGQAEALQTALMSL